MTTDKPFSVGDIVVTTYKTGDYIAEIMELTPPRAVVKTLAVVKHPAQGDLHHPYEVDVPLFHQRRALAHQEKVVVPVSSLQNYWGQVPDYRDSLKTASEAEMASLQRMINWAKRSLVEYENLQRDYFGS